MVAARSGQPVRGGLLLAQLRPRHRRPVPRRVARAGLVAAALAAWMRRTGPRLERLAGGLLIVLGVLLVTGAYQTLTSYLARFTPAVGGL